MWRTDYCILSSRHHCIFSSWWPTSLRDVFPLLETLLLLTTQSSCLVLSYRIPILLLNILSKHLKHSKIVKQRYNNRYWSFCATGKCRLSLRYIWLQVLCTMKIDNATSIGIVCLISAMSSIRSMVKIEKIKLSTKFIDASVSCTLDYCVWTGYSTGMATGLGHLSTTRPSNL